jgi:hypothetical protein
MIAAGYMAKKVSPRPDWIKARAALHVRSVSNCISNAFCDYIKHWKHNGYWFYDSPAALRKVAGAASAELADTELFYYEVHEAQFDEEERIWSPFEPENDFATRVEVPPSSRLLGFDVVTFSVQTSPECSPLSCNNLAESIEVNRHCLLESFDRAQDLLENGAFDDSEPGPFRIFAVHAV